MTEHDTGIEHLHPQTQAMAMEERHGFRGASERLGEYFEYGGQRPPAFLWADRLISDDQWSRNVQKTVPELNRSMERVFKEAGLHDPWQQAIALLKEDGCPPRPNNAHDLGFGNLGPWEALSRLGDQGAALRDEPNSFTVGFALDLIADLLVVKMTSEEFGDKGTDTDQTIHIAIYPTTQADRINWGVSRFSGHA